MFHGDLRSIIYVKSLSSYKTSEWADRIAKKEETEAEQLQQTWASVV